MPSPGDPANLIPNLTTLAQLSNKPGSKLAYNQTTGRFSVDEAGKLQGLLRSFSPDSVTKDDYFGEPIRELFAAARPEINVSIQPNVFANAINGLKSLRSSYANDRAKLTVLDAVIEDAELGMKKDPADILQLRQRYQNYLLYGFAQVMLLPRSNPGVCYSFTVHWARRILIGKPSFGVSKNAATAVHPLTLDLTQKTRMMNKVDRTIRALQAELKQWQPTNFGTAVMQEARSQQRFVKYSNLLIFSCTSDAQPIGDTARGSEVIKAVRRTAANVRATATVFVVSLAPKTGASGHAIGIHLDGALHFFDSNLGEFGFPTGFKVDRDRFLDDWWNALYMESRQGRRVQHFRSWKLEGVCLRT